MFELSRRLISVNGSVTPENLLVSYAFGKTAWLSKLIFLLFYRFSFENELEGREKSERFQNSFSCIIYTSVPIDARNITNTTVKNIELLPA